MPSRPIRLLIGCLLSLPVFMMVGCGGPEGRFESSVRRRKSPQADARRFFANPVRTVRPGASAAFAIQHDGEVRLLKAALTEPLLLVPSLVVASNAPMLEAGQPRIVAFRREGPKVALYAYNPHVVYPGFESDQLLETFDVVREDDDGVTLDWSFGLHAVPLRSPIVGADVAGSVASGIAPTEQVIPILASTLREMTLTDESLLLHQISRVRISQMTLGGLASGQLGLPVENDDLTVHLHLRLSPLVKNPTFVPRPSALQDGIGTFEVARTRPGEGSVDLLATRWDPAADLGPVTFVLTENVPEFLVGPLTEGILYWNRVLGMPLVAVETGGAEDMLPSARRVPVRYVAWRQAEMAYGTLQPHPLTGEILYGDIFLPSAWLELADQKLTASAQQASTQTQLHRPHARRLALAGAAAADRCEMSLAHQSAWGNLSVSQMTPARNLLAQGDLMRWVIAHEVGHVLGLRHNFAASTETEFESAPERQKAFADYLSDPEHLGSKVSSSVMDYLDPIDAFLAGAYIRHATLSYDEAAMAWSYRGELTRANGRATQLYCTDTEASEQVLGCAAFDSGKNPLAGFARTAEAGRESLPDALVDAFAQALQPRYLGDVRSAEEVLWDLNLDVYSAGVASRVKPLFDALLRPTDVLAVRRRTGWLRRLRPLSYEVLKREHIQKWLAEVGGLGALMRSIAFGREPIAPGWLGREIEQRIETRSAGSFALVEGAPGFGVSQQNYQDMRVQAPWIADYLEQSLLRDTVAVLTGGAPGDPRQGASLLGQVAQLLGVSDALQTDPELIDPAWEKDLALFGRFVLLADREAESIGQAPDGTVLYAPYYREDVRLSALRIFDGRNFGKSRWLEQERVSLVLALRTRLLKVASQDDVSTSPLALLGLAPPAPYKISPGVDPKIRAWAEFEVKLLDKLAAQTGPLGGPPSAAGS